MSEDEIAEEFAAVSQRGRRGFPRRQRGNDRNPERYQRGGSLLRSWFWSPMEILHPLILKLVWFPSANSRLLTL